ncbi:hypothetical protein M501DRAFT_994825 [Patellaria atrata CBS 101060]|uniref:Uncharacterized protein n=1 Tax=Patellaria atrata CBS 101060 TaxID=1346257 RepID=A0A9P4VU30_9PEZI|nr:hypothetical protein M501DRAFT_994825 [Patellaria atrata CBS 101060]
MASLAQILTLILPFLHHSLALRIPSPPPLMEPYTPTAVASKEVERFKKDPLDVFAQRLVGLHNEATVSTTFTTEITSTTTLDPYATGIEIPFVITKTSKRAVHNVAARGYTDAPEVVYDEWTTATPTAAAPMKRDHTHITPTAAIDSYVPASEDLKFVPRPEWAVFAKPCNEDGDIEACETLLDTYNSKRGIPTTTPFPFPHLFSPNIDEKQEERDSSALRDRYPTNELYPRRNLRSYTLPPYRPSTFASVVRRNTLASGPQERYFTYPPYPSYEDWVSSLSVWMVAHSMTPTPFNPYPNYTPPPASTPTPSTSTANPAGTDIALGTGIVHPSKPGEPASAIPDAEKRAIVTLEPRALDSNTPFSLHPLPTFVENDPELAGRTIVARLDPTFSVDGEDVVAEETSTGRVV